MFLKKEKVLFYCADIKMTSVSTLSLYRVCLQKLSDGL